MLNVKVQDNILDLNKLTINLNIFIYVFTSRYPIISKVYDLNLSMDTISDPARY